MTDRFTTPTNAERDELRALLEARRERDAALQALSESRARFGDMEARVVELEAVVAEYREFLAGMDEAGEIFSGSPILRLLTVTPSVVLADHDREVAARAWDEGNAAGYRDRSRWTQTPNPYREQS